MVRRMAGSSALALLLFAAPALGWVFEIQFGATVNEHKFHRIKAAGKDCALTVKLWFNAPEGGYDSKAKNRNYHRFQARVQFQNGKSVMSPVFVTS